MKAEAVVA